MVHGANMGPVLGRQYPGGPHVGHVNLAIWEPCHTDYLVSPPQDTATVAMPYEWATHSSVLHNFDIISYGQVTKPYVGDGAWLRKYVVALIRRRTWCFNTLWPKQNGRNFADDIFKCILLNENMWIAINILLNFVPKSQINNIQALVQIMDWRRPGDKPLSEPVMISLLTHICVTRPQGRKDMLASCVYISPKHA